MDMNLLNNIKSKNILVIGDVMLDTYYSGEVKRISPEAPTPVFTKKSEYSVPGGAANVAVNLVAADQKVSVMGMIGRDETGKKLKTAFEEKGINTELVVSFERNTTERTRFLTSNNQQVLRLDVEDTDEINSSDCKSILDELEKRIDSFDLIVLSDYLKGFLSYELTQGVLRIAKTRAIPTIIDVKDSKIDKYRGAYLIKPNIKELRNMTGMPVTDHGSIVEASQYLRELCDCKYILTTCGAGGMVLVGDTEQYFVQSAGRQIFDVTGAGDTTIAYLAVCMINGFTMEESVDIANYAAGIQVSKAGTSAVYWSEVREYLSEQTGRTSHKLLNSQAVDNFRASNANRKVVFTNGCFDILHIGHIRYLQKAAKLGDILVIGLNSDGSVKRLKGSERPVNNEKDRAEILCALSFVDYVVVFEEDTPLELIKKIKPDVLVKGGDYSKEDIVGANEVEAGGGSLVLVPLVEGKSTTNIIKKVKQ